MTAKCNRMDLNICEIVHNALICGVLNCLLMSILQPSILNLSSDCTYKKATPQQSAG